VNAQRDKLKRILKATTDIWDQPNEREGVRRSFQKVIDCKTAALGGEVYSSASGEKVFYHSCKSKACPSCGNRATQIWQRDQWVMLPDVPFAGIVLTMPDVLRPPFQGHRRLQHDLPAIGAAAVEAWAMKRYGIKLCVVVVPHTFGGHLGYNPHLHMMVSVGGMDIKTGAWRDRLEFDRDAIMNWWRLAVTTYLVSASKRGLITNGCPSPILFREQVRVQAKRQWNVFISSSMTKKQFLGYAGRYIRRLPISQRRILSVTAEKVIFQTKDTRTKSLRLNTCTPADFVRLLSQHIADHYKHSMRYFGLLAPRTKHKTTAWVYLQLNQKRRSRPARLPWNFSVRRDFGVDPLIDAKGDRMRWSHREKPFTTRC
jgi:hypothetical protein